MNQAKRKALPALFATLILSATLSGCVSTPLGFGATEPAFATITIANAQQDEQLPSVDDTAQLTDVAVLNTQKVRWGGTITRLENLDQQRTLIEIVSRPLRGSGRPLHNDRSEGRFLVLVDKFLDPEIVVAGRDVTVTGSLRARQMGSIGQTQYLFPIVAADSLKYWAKEVVVRRSQHFPHWNDHPGSHIDSFRDPWFFHRRPGWFR